MKAILTRVASNHKNLRTTEIMGVYSKLPTVGEAFTLLGQGLTPNTIRTVITTAVSQVIKITDYEYKFTTHNSVYKLKILTPNEPTYLCYVCGFIGESIAFHRHISDVKDEPGHSPAYKICHSSHGTRKCFCGGPVVTHTNMHNADDVGWETVCQDCGYLYDED